MSRILVLIFLGFMFSACPPDDQEEDVVLCPDAEAFEVIDFSDLDGCTWMLSSPKYDFNLDPINLIDFVSEPTEGQTIEIEFQIRDDMAGVCMSGRIVEILCIRD